MEKKLALILLDNKINTYNAVIDNGHETPHAYRSFVADLMQLRTILTPKAAVYHTLDDATKQAIVDAREHCGHCHAAFRDGDRYHIRTDEDIPSYYHHQGCWDAMWNGRLPHNNQKETI